MVYNGYYKVMSNVPKMGHLPIPVWAPEFVWKTKGQNLITGYII